MFAGNRTTLTARLASLAVLLASATLATARADEPADPPGRVARVNLTVGAVSLQPAGSESWVSDVLNRPLTNGDKLWADRESRAELHVGSAAVRLGSETGIEMLNIDDRTVQLKLSAGTLQVRVRALAPEETFEIATPTAAVAVLSPGDYRIEVSESGGLARIAVAQGQVAVTDQGHEATVEAGQLAEYDGGGVDQARISALPPGDAFDQWVADRDRREERSVATRYVSRDVIGYEDLDDYGAWRTVDEYGPVWVPTVSVGWAPYRYGHWGWIAPWGWTWIDDAPWGFAPFHYGRWVFYGGNWCWAPGPRRYAPVYAPALVGWVGGAHWGVGVSVGAGGPPVGWFPLGWNEVYVPGYRVSNNYVRNVNVTNIHVSNTVINNYITNNTTVINGPGGRQGIGDRGRPDRRYANFAVPGAVTATSHSAFIGSQPVANHLQHLPREALEKAPVATGAPAIAPTANSLGRPAAMTPRGGGAIWSRPVVARAAPPPPPPSFEAQRQAVVANGGRPVPVRGFRAPEGRPGAREAAPAPRADVIRVGPPAAQPPGQRPGGPVLRPSERPAAAVPPAPRAVAPQPAPRPAPEYRAPAERPAPRASDRGTPEVRPASPPRESAPAPTPRPTPDYRAPAPTREVAPQPAPRPTPEYRAPSPEYRPPAPAREAAPQPAARPTPEYRAPSPEYRPPAPAREAAPQPAARPAPEYRAPAPAREVAPQPAPRPAPEYRAPAPTREVAPQPAPRPAPEYRAPAPTREVTPQPAPRPAPEYRPPAPAREVAPPPAPRPAPEYRAPAPQRQAAPPPPPKESHPAPPHPDKPERDKR